MKRWLIITLISFLLTLFVYPAAFRYPSDTLPDNNDTRLIAYIIGQVQQNLLKLQPLHYGTFFAPDQSTLAYSDLFLTSAALTLPFRFLTHSPIIIFNIALVLNFLLTIFASFLLFEYLFKDLRTTSLAVLLFNFSGFHLHYLPHLQMFSMWLLCLSLYFFLRYLNENRPLFLTLFFAIVTLQLAESIFPVYLIFFATIIIVIAIPPWREWQSIKIGINLNGSPRRVLLAMTKHSLPFIPLWLFLLFPYYQLHTSLPEAIRPIRDAAHFSLGLDQIFTQFHSWTIITIFILCGVVHVLSKIFDAAGALAKNRTDHVHRSRRESRQRRDDIVTREYGFWRGPKRHIFNPWKYIFIFSIIMSLGPILKIFDSNLRLFGFPIPLPYALFYYLLPGFTGFRTPSRFIILALLATVVLIGFKLKPIFAELKTKTIVIFLLLILSLLFLEADLPLRGYPVNIHMHSVYQEVKNLPPDAVILELPIKLWNMPDHEIESIRSLYSLEHLHRRLGGFSGFATNNWINLVNQINAKELSPTNIKALKSLGITHVIQNNQLFKLDSLSF
jgi:hypothetical protein